MNTRSGTGAAAPADAADTYDFIVVGAGSAGCAIAARLSENPAFRVLLLEAGPADRNAWIHIPLGFGKSMLNPALNWMYESGPEPGLGARRIRWPRGRGLGGSSSINGLLYLRGTKQDFDDWEQLGNVGWGFRDVLPCYRKAESHFIADDEHHGSDGPIHVEPVGWKNALTDAIIEAAAESGLPRNANFNGASQIGVGYYHQTTSRWRRSSASVGYLRGAGRRPNLVIRTGCLAERLLQADGRITGVAWSADGVKQRASARREVILCAGTVGSPQLLQLSGIGPASLLQSLGIEVALDLPGVGRNLQDHFATTSMYRINQPLTLNDVMHSWTRKAAAAWQYLSSHSGPLMMPAGSVGAFAALAPARDRSDIQISFAPFTGDTFGGSLHAFSAFRSSFYQLRPNSRGHISIRSADPAAHPEIVGNYLGDAEDEAVVLAGMKLTRKITRSPALAAFATEEFRPGPDVESDSDLLQFARQYGGSSFHPVGTCAMGTGPQAVVDHRLRLRGLFGLRVADGSIMPTLVSGNTNATCLMIGEKCAEMIAAEHRN